MVQPELYRADDLQVEVYPDRSALGEAAAARVAECLRSLLAKQTTVRVVFAAAPSQNEFLAYLAKADGIDWGRVSALHMDEYLGLEPGDERSFAAFLRKHLFDGVHPGTVHYMNATLDPEAACRAYAAIVDAAPIDIVCMGIGENGHIAFNDPGVADFHDPQVVKVVTLDHACRMQQVHDGCFPSLDEVPQAAMTLTVPALMRGRHVFCMVPGSRKAEAVRRTLSGPITPDCPASILRQHPNATLFLDRDAHGLVDRP
ncbi:MAG: glucosamine-6-phosphate deaminase [Alicyclobacillus sp.]|nr:glucosamine-6-phosphate deaminase [Alicyclobacillus sp.]